MSIRLFVTDLRFIFCRAAAILLMLYSAPEVVVDPNKWIFHGKGTPSMDAFMR